MIDLPSLKSIELGAYAFADSHRIVIEGRIYSSRIRQ